MLVVWSTGDSGYQGDTSRSGVTIGLRDSQLCIGQVAQDTLQLCLDFPQRRLEIEPVSGETCAGIDVIAADFDLI
jgi:hypothetical protein